MLFGAGATAHPPKSDDKYAQKSVQLVRGSSFRCDFLQNPYFKSQLILKGHFGILVPLSKKFDIKRTNTKCRHSLMIVKSKMSCNKHRTHANTSPFFTAAYNVERLFNFTDKLCTKQGNSSIFGPQIRGL